MQKPYYDLNQKSTLAQNVRKIKSSCFKEKIAKPTKEEEANDISLAVDLLTISSETTPCFYASTTDLKGVRCWKFGWYAFPSEVVDKIQSQKKTS